MPSRQAEQGQVQLPPRCEGLRISRRAVERYVKDQITRVEGTQT
ncbi:hypothetical protein OG782_04680 [Streptomyces sp. NBC_00876]|nr:hypothetical protein OG782_04680 [Streptomyces sp. NBC_00876]